MWKKFFVILFLCLCLAGCTPEVQYVYLMEGKVKRTEYLPGSWSEHSKTIVHFENGSSVICHGQQLVSAYVYIYKKSDIYFGKKEDSLRLIISSEKLDEGVAE